MPKKPRSDSKLDQLPEPQLMALRDGLLGAWKYEDALAWLASECAVSSSLSALSAFYRRHCAPVLQDRRRLFALKATEFEKAEEEDGLDFTDSAFGRLKQRYFEMVLDPLSDMKEVETLGKMLLDYGKLQLATEKVEQDARRLKILEDKERKAAQAKAELEAAVNKVKDGGLSAEALAMIEQAAGLL